MCRKKGVSLEDDVHVDIRFKKAFRTFFDSNLKIVGVFSVLLFTFGVVNMVQKWNNVPGWTQRIPCVFKTEMQGFFDLLKGTQRFMNFVDLIPPFAMFFVFLYMNQPRRKNATVEDWQPPSLCALVTIYVSKLACTIVLYTCINYKLPLFTPYEKMSQKACEVATSLVFNPPGTLGTILGGEMEFLRNVSIGYFKNSSNFLYPELKDFESYMGADIFVDAGAVNVDDTCFQQDKDASLYETLNQYVKADTGIVNFCKAGNAYSKSQPEYGGVEFPIITLSDQMTNIVNAIALMYYPCQIPTELILQPPRPLSPPRITPNPTVTFAQVCAAMTVTNYTTIGVDLQPFLSSAVHANWSATFTSLSEHERELACIFLAELPDPQTGYLAQRSLLCPDIVFVLEGHENSRINISNITEDWPLVGMTSAIQANVLSRKSNNFGTLLPTNWTTLCKETSNMLDKFPDISVLVKTNIQRFVMQDPRETAAIAKDYLTASGWALIDDMTASAKQLADSLRTDILSINKGITDAIAVAANTTNSLVQAAMTSYAVDLNNSVSNIVDLDQIPLEIIDDCGKAPVADNETSCTARVFYDDNHCVWQDTTKKCGYQYYNQSQFLYDMGPNGDMFKQSNESLLFNIKTLLVDQVGSQTTANLTTIYHKSTGALDAVITDQTIKLETSLNDNEVVILIAAYHTINQAARATTLAITSGINKVQYLIGTFVGFIVVSKMAPFSLAISTGIVKGVVGFKMLVLDSKALADQNDVTKINRFTGLLLFLCSTAMSVPMILIPMFVYQAFANQGFVFTVVGFIVFVVNGMLKGFFEKKWVTIMNLVAVFLMLLGFLLWVFLDENRLIMNALLDYGGAEKILEAIFTKVTNVMFVIKVVLNFGFNFGYSKLIACYVVAWLTSLMFGEFDVMVYQHQNADGTTTQTRSRLYVFNVWRKIDTTSMEMTSKS